MTHYQILVEHENSKKESFFHLSSYVIIFLFSFIYLAGIYADDKTCLFLIEACKNTGHNSTLIFSGSAEIESFFRVSYGTEEELQREIEGRFTNVKKIFSETQIQKMKENMFTMEQYGIQSKQRVLFKGNEQFQGKRRSERCNYISTTKEWIPSTKISFGHGNPNFPETCEFLSWEPISRRASITENFVAIPEFHLFGRLQGRFANEMIDILLNKTSRTEFVFPVKGIEAFKDFLNKSGLVIYNAGEKEYDNGAIASIIEIKKEGKITDRFWIDASRGYVCPLIEHFDFVNNSAILAEEFKSSNFFLHKESGLWFPTDYSVSIYSVTTEKVVHSSSYKITPETVVINQAVSDEEFCIDIPVDGKVDDKRRNRNRHYVADEPGILSLAKGGLDLDRMSWLRTTDGDMFVRQAAAEHSTRMRFILIVFGIAFILLGVYLKILNKKKKK